MASWDVSGDGNAPPDFDDIFKEEEDEDVVETELEEPVLFEVKFNDEEEYHDEEEYLVEAEEVSEAEMASAAEVALEAEPYFEYNVPPAPAVTITAVRDDHLKPLPMTSRSPPSSRAPYTSAAVGPGSPSVLTPFDDDVAMAEEHVFHLADEHQVMQQVAEVAAKHPQQQRCPQRGVAARRGGAAQRGRGRGRGARGQVPSGDTQWERGERLIEVHINDEDVPEDLREMVMRVVNARKAARLRVTNRAKRVREENEEEWIDADDGEVESFFAAEGTSNNFEWSPMGDYQGEREPFLPQQTGVVVASENAYGAFRQYWDDGIMSHIVTETNRYAAGLVGSSASFARDWYDTNVHELFVLFSFWMMLGIIRMPTIKSCFTVNPLLQTNIFRKMFSRPRYENLCRAFHLNDNSSKPTDSTNLLYSLGPIIEHLNARFQETYIPSQNICIDESLTLWKGTLSFRQYVRTKAARFRVKTFELCESSTGYLWSFFVYLGAGTSYDTGAPSTVLRTSTSSVLNLIRPLLDKGYTLFMGNWFNSPLLARFLKKRKTDCVGTLRTNCSNVPPIISLCNLKDGQFVARHSGDVVALAFQDKKRKVATISTYHGNLQGQMEAKPYRPTLYKPQIVLDYNKGMRGVDRKDQMLEPYLLERNRGSKWNIKFFKHLLNCSILNARILLQSSATTRKEHLVFRLELVDQILRHHHQHVPQNRPTRPVFSSLGLPQPQVQHFPQQTDQLANDGRRKRRRCLWCSQHQKFQRTTYTCSVCEVPLCVDPCFALYHK